MRLILAALLLALAGAAHGQGAPVGQPSRVVKVDEGKPTKTLVIIEDAVVTARLVILDEWTEADWASFVPEGATAVVEGDIGPEPSLIGDRFLEGKFKRIVKRPRGDGWHKMEQIDINDPTPEIENPIVNMWEATASYRASGKDFQNEQLKKRLDALERGVPFEEDAELSQPDTVRELVRAKVVEKGGRAPSKKVRNP